MGSLSAWREGGVTVGGERGSLVGWGWASSKRVSLPCQPERAERISTERGLLITFMPLSLVARTEEDPPIMQETWLPSLGREDPLEEEMATHSSILAWRIPQTEEPGRLQSTKFQRVRQD